MSSWIFIAGQKSISGFKSSKAGMTLLLGVEPASNFKLKPMLICNFENS